MDVMARLRGLGLGQYAPACRDNDVDSEILRDLTAEDLAGLGVASIGHRRPGGSAMPASPGRATAGDGANWSAAIVGMHEE